MEPQLNFVYGMNSEKPIGLEYDVKIRVEGFNIANEMAKETTSQKETIFIEALKKHGFEFDNKKYLEEFVKTRCTSLGYIDSDIKTICVDHIPVLVWNEKPKINHIGNTITAEFQYRILEKQ